MLNTKSKMTLHVPLRQKMQRRETCLFATKNMVIYLKSIKTLATSMLLYKEDKSRQKITENPIQNQQENARRTCHKYTEYVAIQEDEPILPHRYKS